MWWTGQVMVVDCTSNVDKAEAEQRHHRWRLCVRVLELERLSVCKGTNACARNVRLPKWRPSFHETSTPSLEDCRALYRIEFVAWAALDADASVVRCDLGLALVPSSSSPSALGHGRAWGSGQRQIQRATLVGANVAEADQPGLQAEAVSQ